MRITRENQTLYRIEAKNPLQDYFIASFLTVISKSQYEYGEYKGELLVVMYPANLRTDKPMVMVEHSKLTTKEVLNNPLEFKNFLYDMLKEFTPMVVEQEDLSNKEYDELFKEDYFN